MEVFDYKVIDSEAIVALFWEGELWSHAIVDRQYGHIELVRPPSGYTLHGSARQGYESTPVYVYQHLVYIRYGLFSLFCL